MVRNNIKNFFEITPLAVELIEKFEGYSKTIYACPAGKPTIGFGHIVRAKDFFSAFHGHFLRRTFKTLQANFSNNSSGYKRLNIILQRIFPSLITRQQAIDLLREDALPITLSMNKLIAVDLTKNQISALISFIYNIGITAFSRSTLLKKLNRKDIKGAAQEFLRWVYVDKTILKGLENRRKAEKTLFLST